VEIYGLFAKAAEALGVVDRRAMAIRRFLNPEKEEEVLAVVVKEVVGADPTGNFTPDDHLRVNNLTYHDDEDEEELFYTLPPIVSLKEAIFHVKDLLGIADERANLMELNLWGLCSGSSES